MRASVRDMLLKPDENKLKSGMGFRHLDAEVHGFRHDRPAKPRPDPLMELAMGAVIQAALHANLWIQSVRLPRRAYLDIGTPEGLRQPASGSFPCLE